MTLLFMGEKSTLLGSKRGVCLILRIVGRFPPDVVESAMPAAYLPSRFLARVRAACQYKNAMRSCCALLAALEVTSGRNIWLTTRLLPEGGCSLMQTSIVVLNRLLFLACMDALIPAAPWLGRCVKTTLR
jgi:hypothetical protein